MPRPFWSGETQDGEQPFGDLRAEAPNLAELIGHVGPLPRSARGSVTHHPLAYLKHGNASWRQETLRVLDRAIEITYPILARTDRIHRYSTRLRDGELFNAAIAELVAGARMAAITTTAETMTIDPPNGAPDLSFDLNGRRVHAEVYAPKNWRDLDILDDIHLHIKSERSSCRFHMVFPRPVARDSRLAKQVAARLRRVASDVEREDAVVATFYAKRISDDWTVHVGRAVEVTGDHDLIGWAHRDDYGPATNITGSVDTKYVTVDTEARNAVSDLDQLVPGETNLLIVDLSRRPMDAMYTLPRYEHAARRALAKHPFLSAVLLTGRTCRPRPSPASGFEAVAWYRIVASNSCSVPFSKPELDLIEQPGLVIPGVGRRAQTSEQ